MKLKNIGNKIGYDDNEVVKFFIGQGNLSEVKSRTAAKEK